MFDKAGIAVCRTYLRAKAKFEKMLKAEDGMETMEAIIMIVVAVILVGFIVNFLTKDGFVDPTDTSGTNKVGLVQYIFGNISVKLGDTFSVAP